MKIENKNKRKMYHDYILKTGKNPNFEVPNRLSRYASAIMRAKPYGGIYGRKMDAQQETAEPEASAG